MPAADLIIINHSAARARRLWPIIQKQLDAARVEYQAYETKGPGDATLQTRAALRSGVESVVVVGGDGTLGETAEGFHAKAVGKSVNIKLNLHVNDGIFGCGRSKKNANAWRLHGSCFDSERFVYALFVGRRRFYGFGKLHGLVGIDDAAGDAQIVECHLVGCAGLSNFQ